MSPRCLRQFSASPPSWASVDPEVPLLVDAPEGHRADTSAGSSSAPLIDGPGDPGTTDGQRRSTRFPPPSPAQLAADHGLYGFFRRNADPNLRGDDMYETFTDPTRPATGRAWLASELRLKSFKDLHTLWYVLLRERNLLATQREEMRRMGVAANVTGLNRADAARCRKSMARIKAVMNERRLAYEGAVELATKEREEATNAEVLKYKMNAETTEKHRQHAEQLRQKHVEAARTPRAGVRVQARRHGEPKPLRAGEKKGRWTKAQKLANAERKQQSSGPRQLHVA